MKPYTKRSLISNSIITGSLGALMFIDWRAWLIGLILGAWCFWDGLTLRDLKR